MYFGPGVQKDISFAGLCCKKAVSNKTTAVVVSCVALLKVCGFLGVV